MGKSKIEWTDMVWNPVTGCTKVSEGCQNCYAERMAMRFTGHFNVTCHPDRLDQPLHWKKPRRIFVCSMGDLFHEDVPDDFIGEVISKMSPYGRKHCAYGHHTYMILTKRPERMAKFFQKKPYGETLFSGHVWLGVTAENQKQADKRIPILLQIPAAKRFVSMEPLLGPVDIHHHLTGIRAGLGPGLGVTEYDASYLDWVIAGAESGPKRRSCKLKWIEDIKDQCYDPGTPLFIKQLHINGKLSKNMDEWPEDLRVRQWPD